MSRIHDNNSSLDNLTPLGHAIEAAVEPVRTLLQAVAGWHPLRRLDAMIRIAHTRRDLRNLDDRLLRDIGVSRLDVERESRRRFWDVDDRFDA
jgi:uncharacterized protein YjiS (DUF1127 family)